MALKFLSVEDLYKFKRIALTYCKIYNLNKKFLATSNKLSLEIPELPEEVINTLNKHYLEQYGAFL